jgi:hypothetical protein
MHFPWFRNELDAGVIINPAGFSFASVSALDAVTLVQHALIELHIANIQKPDETYRPALVSRASMGVICGLGRPRFLSPCRQWISGRESSLCLTIGEEFEPRRRLTSPRKSVAGLCSDGSNNELTVLATVI